MSIKEYIGQQLPERQALLSNIHQIIIKLDKTVTAEISPMMGKEMIIYNAPGTFKYGLASVKKYISLHVLPMYGSPVIYQKYQKLLPEAAFQKGCINFLNEEEMPLEVVKQLIADCAKVDLLAIRQAYLEEKKKKAVKVKK